MRSAVVLLALLPLMVNAQTGETADIWKPFRPIIGEWRGTGRGMSGESTLRTDVDFVFGERYIRIKTRAVFEPQEKNTKGEVHEDVGYISYDRGRKKFVFRQFHVEGFVNRYVLENEPGKDGEFIFVSEQIENAPPGLRAKEIYKLGGDGELGVSFFLAMPGKELSCYSENVLLRVEGRVKKVNKITANLMMKDVNSSVDFYRDVLGFELVMSVPESGKLDWAMMKAGGAEVMFQSRESVAEEYPPFADMPIGGSLMLYIDVVDVGELYEKVKGKAKLVVDLHDTFYGAREFAIEDTDGYVLIFAQQVQQ